MESSSRSAMRNVLKKGFRFLGLLVIIVLVTWFIKAFLFSVYYIPSGSMEPTLSRGDYVLVSKFPYNLRTPEYYPLTDIPFPFMSTGGFGEVRRGDIVVFDLPLFPTELHPIQKEDYIKRVVGMPGGDTLAVSKGYYYLQRNINLENIPNESLITVVRIPEKGMQIQLIDSTKKFWDPLLFRDGNSITYNSLDNVLINGSEQNHYFVKQNYYFVQGDNTNFSSDSRSWGLVPKQNLIGRAELVLWPWPPRWL